MEHNKIAPKCNPIDEAADELMRLLQDKAEADQAGEILIALRQRAIKAINDRIGFHNQEIVEIQKRIEALEYSAKNIQVSI